jgi:hypothetical protein
MRFRHDAWTLLEEDRPIYLEVDEWFPYSETDGLIDRVGSEQSCRDWFLWDLRRNSTFSEPLVSVYNSPGGFIFILNNSVLSRLERRRSLRGFDGNVSEVGLVTDSSTSSSLGMISFCS